jgi:hypothetical protein
MPILSHNLSLNISALYLYKTEENHIQMSTLAIVSDSRAARVIRENRDKIGRGVLSR